MIRHTKPLAVLALAALLPVAALAQNTSAPRTDRQQLIDRLAELEAAQTAARAELEALDADPQPQRDRQRPNVSRHDQRADPRANQRTEQGAILRDIDPQMRERFERFRRNNPERAQRFLDQHRPKLEEMRQLRENDPEAFERRAEAMRTLQRAGRLAAQVALAEDAGDTENALDARQQLRAEAEALFAARLELHRQSISKMQTRLDDARAKLATAEANRDDLIEQRTQQAIDDARRRLHNARP